MPDWKDELRQRLSNSRLSPERELEIIEELSQHLEEEYERAVGRGASEEEAHHAALADLDLSSPLGAELESAAGRAPRNPPLPGRQAGSSFFADLLQDVRYGLRMLRKNPGFTCIAVLALALGIGANTAIFSVVDAILLKPLPYKNPSQLVVIWENATHLGFPKNTPSPANFLDWQKQNASFDGMAAFAERSFNLTGVGEPERLDGRRVSANLFDLLGVKPLVGRTFVSDEDKPGTKVAIINESLGSGALVPT